MNPLNTANYKVSLQFVYEDEISEQLYTLMVPANVTPEHIKQTLKSEHEELNSRAAKGISPDLYSEEGENAMTLLWHINQKYGWEYAEIEPDFEIVLA